MGEHSCLFYGNRRQQFEVIVPFIRDGIDNNDKIVYVHDDNSEDDVRSELEKHHLPTTDIRFISSNESYLRGNKFSIKDMIDLLEKLAVELDGHTVRLTGEMTWCIRPFPLIPYDGCEQVVDYECSLHQFFARHLNITSICQYNVTKIPLAILLEICACHVATINKSIIVGLIKRMPITDYIDVNIAIKYLEKLRLTPKKRASLIKPDFGTLLFG